MVNIIATGNYNFFNLLTICLSISLLDDQFFYKGRTKTGSSKILNYLSILACVVVYLGILYGTHIYYNMKFAENWTIHTKIGFYL